MNKPLQKKEYPVHYDQNDLEIQYIEIERFLLFATLSCRCTFIEIF